MGDRLNLSQLKLIPGKTGRAIPALGTPFKFQVHLPK